MATVDYSTGGRRPIRAAAVLVTNKRSSGWKLPALPGLDWGHIAAVAVGLAGRNITCYALTVIGTFRHSGIERFFKTGSKAGIQPKHEARLRILLTTLNLASTPLEMNRDGWGWHPLKGDLKGHWAVSVRGNWRLTFTFKGEDAILVDYQDYH